MRKIVFLLVVLAICLSACGTPPKPQLAELLDGDVTVVRDNSIGMDNVAITFSKPGKYTVSFEARDVFFSSLAPATQSFTVTQVPDGANIGVPSGIDLIIHVTIENRADSYDFFQ